MVFSADTSPWEEAPPVEEGQEPLVWANGQFVTCDQEPIHIPGSVQSFGALLAIRVSDWEVRQVSENAIDIIGISAHELLHSKSLKYFLDSKEVEHLNSYLLHLSPFPNEAGPEVFPIKFKPREGDPVPPNTYFCAAHRFEKNPDLLILEIEIQDDERFPLALQVEQESESGESTENERPSSSKATSTADPIPRSFPTHLSLGEITVTQNFDSMMGVFNVIGKVNAFLGTKKTIRSLSKELARIVQGITGFDRVLIYEFDQQWNGEVIAECIGLEGLESFMGLHFPSTDIPKQARELYLSNKIRLLYSRDLKPARILCKSQEDLARPLDLTFSYLRAMSVIHLKYLRNMGVQSSMSISLICSGKLWGLIACHGYSPRRVSLFTRKFCRMLGDTASRTIESIVYEKRLMSRQVITEKATERIARGKDMNEYIVAKAEDLLQLFAADIALISIEDEAKVMGLVEESNDIVKVLEYLRQKHFVQITHTDCIDEHWSDFPVKSSAIAGILLIPLSRGGKDFIAFIRKEQLKHVHWAGNPVKSSDDTQQLEPRSSFKKWTQVVDRRSRVWTDDECEVGTVLQLVYWKFIEIWRQRDEAVQSNRLKNLLLANVSHEVRTPLNAIINYLEIALEQPMEEELRSAIGQAHRSSKSLIFIINDLLDLTRIEAGKMLFRTDPFPLMTTIKDAARMFEIDAIRKKIEFEIIEGPGIPEIVYGDSSKIRQVIVNLCCNAMKFTTEGYVRVYCQVTSQTETHASFELAVVDSGIGIPHDKLAVIFEDFEQVESSLSQSVQGAGLGLAIVARIVKNMNGLLRVESEPNKGSRFTVLITFPILEGVIAAPSPVKRLSVDLGPQAAATPLTGIEGVQVQVNETNDIKAPKDKEEFKSQFEFKPAAPPKKIDLFATRDASQSLVLLYAEDDLVNQQIIQKRLQKLNYQVEVCHNGKECAELFKQNPTLYDVILMDVNMPLCNGIEATDRIRSIEQENAASDLPVSHKLNRNRIPILAVSASVYDSDVGRCIAAGMDGFVNKPVNLKLLDILLQSALNREERETLIMDPSGGNRMERQEGAWFEDRLENAPQ